MPRNWEGLCASKSGTVSAAALPLEILGAGSTMPHLKDQLWQSHPQLADSTPGALRPSDESLRAEAAGST
eukprot:CAMPEP_0202362668 /NCGR_PEP_ID=MMETSP1126-20121109/14766_1 /ASSEMBLY_ACC=CAM_ASM_000457 /TAXON_ID=3047 /ORGANISM="Dunaliella tertiolecta, Strain CCMP1320" /LENGTH=69 /DNA_ID=CAMNT_0048956921 /DNA_START=949 /DNA_END=1158 /DNA_ORIENTATION=+